jgi:hypothetical protein
MLKDYRFGSGRLRTTPRRYPRYERTLGTGTGPLHSFPGYNGGHGVPPVSATSLPGSRHYALAWLGDERR